jgi:hypothetical protein
MSTLPTIEIYGDAHTNFHWRMKDAEGRILCWSKRRFKTPAGARKDARWMMARGKIPTAPALEETYSATTRWSLEKY